MAVGLDFVVRAGPRLAAYPEYHRVAPDEDGVWRVPDARLARRHRMNIGTIVSDASMQVKFWRRRRQGRQRRGRLHRAAEAGRLLPLRRPPAGVRARPRDDGLRAARAAKKAAVPRWNGGRMPLSSELADAVVRAARLPRRRATSNGPRCSACARCSRSSSAGRRCRRRDAAGRSAEVARGLAPLPLSLRRPQRAPGPGSLLAWRVAQQQPNTFSIAVNDYGLELLSATPVDSVPLLNPGLLSPSTCWTTCSPA